jgi:hypothetical protein
MAWPRLKSGANLQEILDTLSLFVLTGLGVIYRASTRRTARQVLCGWQQKLAGEGWTRIPTRQDAVALRNQIRVVTCMFRHVRLAGQDPLHGQLSRAGLQGRLVKTPSRAQPMGKTGGYKHMESA